MIKKLLTTFILISYFLSPISSPAFAQDNTITLPPTDYGAAQRNETGNLYQAEAQGMDAFIGSGVSFIVDSQNIISGNGALQGTSRFMAYLIDQPPVRTSTYVADVLKNANLVPQAYAQGIGFSSLTPVLTIWKAFRNMAYFAFILIFVVIGFMIMMRHKIDSHTVANIQEALPKLIVTLILVTFSYAIAGLVIDAMYLVIFMVTGIFQQFGVLTNASQMRNLLFGRNILHIAWNYFMGVDNAAGLAAEGIGNIISQVFMGLVGFLANGLVYLIIAVALLIAAFKTLFQLITAYVGIILSVIFAPIQLLMNAIPGSDAGKKWFQGLVANAAVFPVAAIMIIIGIVLAGTNASETANIGVPETHNSAGFQYDGFLPPLIGTRYSEAGSVSAVKSIIGLGFLLLLPEIIKLTHELFAYKTPWYGESVMKNYEAGSKPVGSVIGAPFNLGGKFIGGVATQTGATVASDLIRKIPFIENMQKKNLERQASDRATEQQLYNRKLWEQRNPNMKWEDRNKSTTPIVNEINNTPTSVGEQAGTRSSGSGGDSPVIKRG